MEHTPHTTHCTLHTAHAEHGVSPFRVTRLRARGHTLLSTHKRPLLGLYSTLYVPPLISLNDLFYMLPYTSLACVCCLSKVVDRTLSSGRVRNPDTDCAHIFHFETVFVHKASVLPGYYQALLPRL